LSLLSRQTCGLNTLSSQLTALIEMVLLPFPHYICAGAWWATGCAGTGSVALPA